jgi:RNA polymerase sigma-70 factor (ECF subfamily)
MLASPSSPVVATRALDATAGTRPAPAEVESLVFDDVYEAHFDFVWRSVRRLGVHDDAVDDVVQEIFIVVDRRLQEFEARSSLKTWIFGVALRIVRDHRRQVRRKSPHSLRPEPPDDPETLSDKAERGPHESAAKAEAVRVLRQILDELDDDKREVFVLAELEQMTVPQIAEALELNSNTIYSRLRAARQQFDEAVARHRARDVWRLR